MTDLTTVETDTLISLERVIEKGKATVIEVANALRKIRDGKLYRGTHKTFEAYCQERWDFSRRYANQICQAAEVIETVAKTGTIVPKNEAQARPLARLPKDEQAPAWQEAVSRSNGKPTAKVVEEVVEERKPRAKKSADPVGDACKHVFEDGACTECYISQEDAEPPKVDKRTEFNFGANVTEDTPAEDDGKADLAALQAPYDEMLNAITQIKKTWKLVADDERNGVYAIDKRQRVLSVLDELRPPIAQARPHALCNFCGGKGCKKCQNCGWWPRSVVEGMTK